MTTISPPLDGGIDIASAELKDGMRKWWIDADPKTRETLSVVCARLGFDPSLYQQQLDARRAVGKDAAVRDLGCPLGDGEVVISHADGTRELAPSFYVAEKMIEQHAMRRFVRGIANVRRFARGRRGPERRSSNAAKRHAGGRRRVSSTSSGDSGGDSPGDLPAAVAAAAGRVLARSGLERRATSRSGAAA